mmetsp:Transcript_20281/g.58639  ORF Transcript_20281/g.58639 Transcript_20281/m.58639 type:complete len:89 (+) Transcript_20281:914-1180(+)
MADRKSIQNCGQAFGCCGSVSLAQQPDWIHDAKGWALRFQTGESLGASTFTQKQVLAQLGIKAEKANYSRMEWWLCKRAVILFENNCE